MLRNTTVAGRVGVVVAHHEDGIAFRVDFDGGGHITCDPNNVQPARADAKD